MEGWKSGCWPEVFAVSNTSKSFFFFVVAIKMPHSCSTYCIQGCWQTLLSHPGEADEHLEAASEQEELRRSCKITNEASGEMKDCRLLRFDFFQKRWHFCICCSPGLPCPSSLPWAPAVTAIRARMQSSLPDCRDNSLVRAFDPNAHHSCNAAHRVTTVVFIV